MSRLRPCPFCGGEMSEKNFFSCDGYPQACGCWEQTHTGEEAIKVWNTRPIEDRLRNDITGYRRTILEQHQRIVELEQKYERLRELVQYVADYSTVVFVDGYGETWLDEIKEILNEEEGMKNEI